jgi:hypothetical protein
VLDIESSRATDWHDATRRAGWTARKPPPTKALRVRGEATATGTDGGAGGGIGRGSGASARRNAHLTHQENRGVGRHGWLRLTPAYSYRLVAEALAHRCDEAPVVLDPFSGSGTTGLVAAEHGLRAHLVDVNPFLVWFATAKTRSYDLADLDRAREVGHAMAQQAPDLDPDGLWAPALHRIERWWPPAELDALSGCGTCSTRSRRPSRSPTCCGWCCAAR